MASEALERLGEREGAAVGGEAALRHHQLTEELAARELVVELVPLGADRAGPVVEEGEAVAGPAALKGSDTSCFCCSLRVRA